LKRFKTALGSSFVVTVSRSELTSTGSKTSRDVPDGRQTGVVAIAVC